MINIQKMWDSGYTGEGVNIAVIDTGLSSVNNQLHPELNPDKILLQLDCNSIKGCVPSDVFDDTDAINHGTHVTGIIAAKHNGKGIKGIAPDANILVFRTGNDFELAGHHYLYYALSTIYEYNKTASEEKKIHIINISKDYFIRAIGTTDLINQLYEEQGVLVVAAGGNLSDVTSEPFGVAYPAQLENVIGVANINNNGTRYLGNVEGNYSSKVGEGLNVAVPGVNIMSIYPNDEIAEFKTKLAQNVNYCYGKEENELVDCLNFYTHDDNYVRLSGTSQSTPIVSGYLALLKQQFPNDSAQELRRKLLVNTVPRPGKTSSDSEIPGNLEYGNGILQAVPYGKKFTVSINQNTSFYTIPYDSADYLVSKNVPTEKTLLEVYLEWDDSPTRNEGE